MLSLEAVQHVVQVHLEMQLIFMADTKDTIVWILTKHSFPLFILIGRLG